MLCRLLRQTFHLSCHDSVDSVFTQKPYIIYACFQRVHFCCHKISLKQALEVWVLLRKRKCRRTLEASRSVSSVVEANLLKIKANDRWYKY